MIPVIPVARIGIFNCESFCFLILILFILRQKYKLFLTYPTFCSCFLNKFKSTEIFKLKNRPDLTVRTVFLLIVLDQVSLFICCLFILKRREYKTLPCPYCCRLHSGIYQQGIVWLQFVYLIIRQFRFIVPSNFILIFNTSDTKSSAIRLHIINL